MLAGNGAVGSPRTALNAASCSANELVGLKNRNGFSTSQVRSAAWLVVMTRLEVAARLANRVAAQMVAQAVARVRRRIRPSPTPSEGYDTPLALRRDRNLYQAL